MAEIHVVLKRSSVKPIIMQLLQGDGSPLPTEGASIRWQMRRIGSTGPLDVDRAATFTDETEAIAQYTPTLADVSNVGEYQAEWRVTYAGGDIVLPEEGYIHVTIEDDLS